MPIHSSAIAEYPVFTVFIETNLVPLVLSFPSPVFIGLESWSSATPNIKKYLVCSQSGSPNSQNDPPIVYSPAAAIFTEQKPPWAA